jgi:ABC-2 type transport system ATP-binding protein
MTTLPYSTEEETPAGDRLAAALQVRGLTKRFGDLLAVHDLDLRVPVGCIFGFLGPNGAGKTTTINCLTGLMDASSGTIELLGERFHSDAVEVKRRIGVMPQSLALFDHLTAPEFLLFQASMFSVAVEEAKRRVTELMEALELADATRRRLADLSTGMRKKVAFAAAVIHSPELLFLDEPFESIDPNGAAMMKRWLRQFTSSGRTVFLTSHVLDTVERLCDEAAIINAGELAWQGKLTQLRESRRVEWQGRSYGSMESLFLDIVGHSDATPAWL